MGSRLLNTETLTHVGIKLLPEEELKVAVELEDGVTEDLEQSHAILILTDKRFILYSMTGHSNNVVNSGLSDVDSIDVNRRPWTTLVPSSSGSMS